MLKITKGVWEVRDNRIVGAVGTLDEESVAKTNTLIYPISNSESICIEKANADFIAEAGTVANETGFMPREMAEQNRSLLNALKTLRASLNNYVIEDSPVAVDMADRAIQKCEKRG